MKDNRKRFQQRRMSGFLAAALLFVSLTRGIPAGAETFPSETIPAETLLSEPSAQAASEAAVPAGLPEEETPSPAPSEPAAAPKEPEAAPPAPDTLWHPVPPEEILPTDILAVTITKGLQTWALSSENGDFSAPAAVPVTLENGVMLSGGDHLRWQLRREESGMILSPQGSGAFLYADKGNDSLRVGSAGSPHFLPEGDSLLHLLTGRYLAVGEEEGIWLTPAQAPPGQSLAFWRLPRTAPVTASPSGGEVKAGTAITLACADDAADIYYALSSDGEHYGEAVLYTQAISFGEEQASLFVRAYTVSGNAPASEVRVFSYTRETLPEEAPDWQLPYRFCFGQLHAHTAVSDGLGTPEEAYRAAAQAGLDFYAVTEHSDSLDNAPSGSLSQEGCAISSRWAEGKAAAAAATGEDFVGIYGFEISWPQGYHLGHIAVFDTPGWQTWKQEGFDTLESFYQALTQVPEAIGQFCHPGSFYGDFAGFSHRTAAYDRQMALLEVGGEGDFRAYDAYIQALDAGWHAAPASNHSPHDGNWLPGDARTVILADTLSEDGLYEAIRSRRVYASDDADLQLYFTLDGAAMGSILAARETHTLHAWLRDPSGESLGLVEVVCDGGAVLASQTLSEAWAQLEFSLSGSHSYYFLRLTQEDGDIAVTAPVWTDSLQDVGIGSFTAGSRLPVEGQETTLTLEVYNEEAMDFTLTSLELLLDGTTILTLPCPGTIAAGTSRGFTLSHTHPLSGPAEFLVRIQGTIGGEVRCREAGLELVFHPAKTEADILIDGSHENADLGSLTRFTALAAQKGMQTSLTMGYVPADGKLLVVTAPKGEFSEDFLRDTEEFLAAGGSLLLCGQGENPEAVNALLTRVGSAMSLGEKTGDWHSPGQYPADNLYTKDIPSHSFYHHKDGFSVKAGNWLVKDDSGAVLLAWEETAYGGGIILAGSSLCSDEALPEPKNAWDPLSANQYILDGILEQLQSPLPVSAISDVRRGRIGEIYRIQGFATTATAGTTAVFPDMVCIQDRTGGIPILGLDKPGILLDSALDITGSLREVDGNLVLLYIRQTPNDTPMYRHAPSSISCTAAMDYSRRGGSLLQVEGTIRSLKREGKAITGLVIQDIRGSTASLTLAADNELARDFHVGDAVKARGILFRRDGESVLRMRRSRDLTPLYQQPGWANPMVGDEISQDANNLFHSGGALTALGFFRRRRSVPALSRLRQFQKHHPDL